jgi:hypothetical protein
MRTFKFRVWDNVDYMSSPFSFSDIQESNIQFTKGCIVMQYTGLKDKNGVDIYEGDLLDENGYLFEVIWDKQWAKFKLQWRTKAIQFPEWNRGVQMSIIGNIYQNQDLIKPNL